MKYFEATAVTPYCGEELTGFYMAGSEEKLRESGELDRLIEDCVAEWFDGDEYDTYGFTSPADLKLNRICVRLLSGIMISIAYMDIVARQNYFLSWRKINETSN